jgi:hypothetical protein
MNNSSPDLISSKSKAPELFHVLSEESIIFFHQETVQQALVLLR